jgi:LEA14-like dessication related protein
MLLLWGMLTGCGYFLATPTVEVRDVAIVGLSPAGLDLELLLTVTNPNSVPITLTGYTYDLQISALPMTTGGARQEVLFKAAGPTDVRLPVRLSFAALAELLKRGIDPERVPYRLQAGLQVATPLGERVIAIDAAGFFTIPKRYRPAEWLKSLQGIVDNLLPTP